MAVRKKRRCRLDMLLVQRGMAASQEEAARQILAGTIIDQYGKRLDKPGMQVSEEIVLTIKTRKEHRFVSRAALKLEAAFDHFSLDVKDKIAADIGACTGGFTEILLEQGMAKVYAVDVGYGELAWSLRNDPRVVVLERTNACHLTEKQIPEPLDIVVCDASFIRLQKVLPAALALTHPNALLVALIKPQFEAHPSEVPEGGVITDPELHRRVCEEVQEWIAAQGWETLGIKESPIKGMEGNKEFLIGARRHDAT